MIDIKARYPAKAECTRPAKGSLPDCLDHCLCVRRRRGLGNSWRIHENDLGLGRGKRYPTIWLRVVWGLGVTMVTFWPRMELSKVDFCRNSGPMRPPSRSEIHLNPAFGNESLFLSLCFPIYFPASSSAATDGRIFAFQQLGGSKRRRRWRYSPYCRPGHNFPPQPRNRRRQPLRRKVFELARYSASAFVPAPKGSISQTRPQDRSRPRFWHCPKTFSYSLTVSGPMSRIISSAGTLSTGCIADFLARSKLPWPLQHQQAGAVPCQPFASSIIFLASRHKIRFIASVPTP